MNVTLRALEPFSKGDYITVNADGTAHRMEAACARWLGRAWLATRACTCPRDACTCDRSVDDERCTHVHAIAAESAEEGQEMKAIVP